MVTKNKTKKFRSVIMTAAAILAIGGAMAGKRLNTYYAIEDSPGSSSYHWSTSIPAGFTCQSGSAVCSLQSATQPANNQLPSGVSSSNQVYRDTE